MARISWGDSPYGSSLTVKVGENLALSHTPTGGTGGVEYKTSHVFVCTVDDDGTVTGVGVGECSVLGRWLGDSTAGASDWVALSMTIVQGDGPTDLTGEYLYGTRPTLKVGEDLEVVEMPLTYGGVVYRVKSGSEGFCQVDAARGVVRGLAVGSCTVVGTLTGNRNYTASLADLLTVNVQPGVQIISGGSVPFGTSVGLAVGETLNMVNPPRGSQNGVISYRIKPGFYHTVVSILVEVLPAMPSASVLFRPVLRRWIIIPLRLGQILLPWK